MLAYSVWQHHRDALRIRAVFGAVITPSMAGYQRGDEPTYAVVCAYDFDLPRLSDHRLEAIFATVAAR